MARIDDAIEALKMASIAEPRAVPPPTPGQIAAAERSLGLTFPQSFRVFLERAGAYALPFWQTYWIGDESLGYRNIVEANRSEREEAEPALPPFLVTFHNNGMGDQLCFDTRNPDESGEYTIVFWDHELSREENLENLEVVADSFAEWLMDEIEDAS
jgi:cell wall assembly regulator SMI1